MIEGTPRRTIWLAVAEGRAACDCIASRQGSKRRLPASFVGNVRLSSLVLATLGSADAAMHSERLSVREALAPVSVNGHARTSATVTQMHPTKNGTSRSTKLRTQPRSGPQVPTVFGTAPAQLRRARITATRPIISEKVFTRRTPTKPACLIKFNQLPSRWDSAVSGPNKWPVPRST